MGLTLQQQRVALVLAALVLLVLIAAAVAHHEKWMKGHCVCKKGSGFHGWRFQQYDDNPYTHQEYHCGYGGEGYDYPRQEPAANPPSHYPRGADDGHSEGFSGDTDNWPGSGTFGALADTFPYGNYADSQAMFYPTYDEYNPYWTRS